MAVQDGKKEEALRHLTKAVEIAPRDSTARLAIGRFYALGGDIAKAEQHLKTSTSLNPRSFDAWASLADLYRQAMGKPVDAIAAYRQALKLNADHVAARVGLASALTSTGQRQEAVAEAKKLEGMAPQNAGVLRTVGRIYSLSGQFDDAMRVYDQVLKIDPKSTVTRLDRGDLYAGKSDWTRANAEYQAATTDPQTASVAHLKAGTMFERTEQWKNAEAAYLKAVQADPKNAFAYNNLAWLSAERRTRLVEALGWIDKAIALNPQMASFHDTRAWVLRASGDLPSAAKAMTVAASASPPQARFYYRLGLIYGEMGRQADAKAAMKKSLELDPEFTRAEDARRRQAAAK
jgi:tetratricopeptide (TPR) repeat protein